MKPRDRQSGDRQNNNDREPRGNFKTDNRESYKIGENDAALWNRDNPNAMGPTMRPVYDATASAASHWADQHDANPEDVPYPRVDNSGEEDVHFRGRDDGRYGPAGKFDVSDYPYAGKQGKSNVGPRARTY